MLGQGGFGITYKGVDEKLNREVAIKEYLPQQFATRNADGDVVPRSEDDAETFAWGLARFIDEARALAMFRHNNIVSVLRYFEANGTAYLVMDYEQGIDLKGWMQSHGTDFDGARFIREIVLPIVDGLAHVHEAGVVHRDIKPDNIFIRDNGAPVLIDFGAARSTLAENTQKMTSIISEGYSPFEQYGGDQQGPWTDLYALAGTLYHVVTGRPPVGAIARHQGQALTPASELVQDRFEPSFLRAIDQSLALDVAARPQSAEAFRRLVTGTGDSDATYVRPASADTATGKSRRGWLYTGVAAAVMALAGGYYAITELGFDPIAPAPADTPVVTTQTPVAEPTPGQDLPIDTEPEPVFVAPRKLQQPAYPAEAIPRQLTGEVLLGFALNERGEVQDPYVVSSQPGDVFDAAALAAMAGAEFTPQLIDGQPQAIPTARYTMRFEPPPLSEGQLIEGLELPAEVAAFRTAHISGVLLSYIEEKDRLDACLAIDCPEGRALFAQVQKALENSPWQQAPYSGEVRVLNPRRLSRDDCPFIVDLIEIIRTPSAARSQNREYCTSNGFDRTLQSVEPVTDVPL